MAFKMKGFKPHNMYDKQKAETHDEHLALKEKGYKHSPYKACWDGYSADGTKPSPSGKKTKSGNMKQVPDCKPD
jgi:hypothetical protein|tara:strand:+ start:262 stop:483 length:222 start_codon:yes stop_codon:yes gene_type:complete